MKWQTAKITLTDSAFMEEQSPKGLMGSPDFLWSENFFAEMGLRKKTKEGKPSSPYQMNIQ